ncbi:beta-2-glycoprotein 1-like [Watersipora subatra]|uniref:beta-2-glycoprotein 1-like n=1 Tax=Watersipora subatra TaxID=2589382 RepID=UPI00355BA7F8
MVKTGSERSLSLSCSNDGASPLFGTFVVRVTVLHCGDVPVIAHSNISTPPTPWLPGSKVTYRCMNGWILNQTSRNSIDCLVDGNSQTARWTSHSNILCVPKPQCQNPPIHIPNSEYKLGEDNHTATYECIKGYTANSSVSDRKVVCSTPDRLTTPWKWNSSTFQCVPVECTVDPSISLIGIKETSVADGHNGYYVNSTFLYECNFGYKRLDTSEIECTADGNWSSSPNCTEIVECNMTTSEENFTNGNSTEKRYYYGDKLDYECDDGYKGVDEVLCTSNGTWSNIPMCSMSSSLSTSSATNGTSSTTPKCSLSGFEGNEKVTPNSQKDKERDIIVISTSVGGFLLLAIAVVVLVWRCIRKPRNKESETQPESTTPQARQESHYHSLEPPDVIPPIDVGMYSMVDINSGPRVNVGARAKPMSSHRNESQQPAGDLYAELGPRRAPKPPRKAQPLNNPEEPVYEESPALPVKLDPVIMEENSLYESSGHPASAHAVQKQPMEMFDNDLYDQS